MGKDQQLRNDPTRAREHAAGAPVNVIQVLTHSQLGAISYFWPRHWMFHAHAAAVATALRAAGIRVDDLGTRLYVPPEP